MLSQTVCLQGIGEAPPCMGAAMPRRKATSAGGVGPADGGSVEHGSRAGRSAGVEADHGRAESKVGGGRWCAVLGASTSTGGGGGSLSR